MTTASSMQAALYVREKQRQRRKKIRRGRVELPSNVATKEIAPFPRYPPNQWGKAAWQERDRERRVSLTEVAVNHRIKATEAHRRWMKRNRIHDSSFGGSSSDDEDYPGGLYGHQSAAANALLYVGLGTVAIGLVISFVGTGEKGFKTLELRLIGPTLIGSGLLCCLVRIFLCVCPSRCFRRRHKHRHRHKSHLDEPQAPAGHFNHHTFFETTAKEKKATTEDIALADQTKLLQKNTNNKKTVSILTTPVTAATASNAPVPSGSSGPSSHHHHQQQPQQQQQPKQQQQQQQPIPQNVVASTSLFLQHEQERSSLQVPALNIPNFIGSNSDEEDILREESKRKDSNLLDLELQQLEASTFDICSFDSSNEKDGILGNGRAGSAGSGRNRDSDKRRTSITSVHRNGCAAPAASTSSPSTRIGLVNPDPDAHKLEEEMLLLEEEIQPSSGRKNVTAAAVPAPSPGKHSDIDDLLQNEIVLSPSKLQQAVREP
ncbi:uncharacterized protein [Periplaneta americana]|uniref:uncharacterized protein n=1 Tax=Periplaneta americana TaxID=6978 RepID=UPI0037E7371D